MHIEDFQAYCLSKKGVEETFPFREYTLVYKVMGKMFTMSDLREEELSVDLKCDPERSVQLREEFPESVHPPFMKTSLLWNKVYFERDLNDDFLKELIDHSYDLVVKNMRKKDREILENL